MTATTMPAEIAADLRAHGIDPATAEYHDGRTRIGNGGTVVKLPGKPPRVAVMWFVLYDICGQWALKLSGRYVRDAEGEVRLFPSAGAALAWREGAS